MKVKTDNHMIIPIVLLREKFNITTVLAVFLIHHDSVNYMQDTKSECPEHQTPAWNKKGNQSKNNLAISQVAHICYRIPLCLYECQTVKNQGTGCHEGMKLMIKQPQTKQAARNQWNTEMKQQSFGCTVPNFQIVCPAFPGRKKIP